MNGKRNAIIVAIFIFVLFILIGFIGISSHIPFLKNALMLLFALALAGFVLIFFIVIIRRRK